LGVVGAGNIGLHVIRIGRAFGMEVLAYDAHPHPLLAEVLGFRYVSLDELLTGSDVITLHVPYRPETHHLIDRDRLTMMKPGALILTPHMAWYSREAIDRILEVTALNIRSVLSGTPLNVIAAARA
jgi:lactate dehydrogenase-like 2-hydroxyacid dehydrogenase